MSQTIVHPQNAMKLDVEVRDNGRIEFQVPLPSGSRVVVFVVPETQEPFGALQDAAQSSMAFWDNPLDDEDWNNA